MKSVTTPVTTPQAPLKDRVLFMLLGNFSPSQIAKITKTNRMAIKRAIDDLVKENKVKIMAVNKRTFRYLIPLVTTHTHGIAPVTTFNEAEQKTKPLCFRFENVRIKFPLLDLGTYQGRPVANLKYDRYIEKYGNHLLIEINKGKTPEKQSAVVVFRLSEWKEEPLKAKEEFITRATQALTDFANRWNMKFLPNPKLSGKIVQAEAAIATPEAPAICDQVGFFKNDLGQYDKSNHYGEKEYTGKIAFELADKHLYMPLTLERTEKKIDTILQENGQLTGFGENLRTHLGVMQDIRERNKELIDLMRAIKEAVTKQ